MLKKRGWGTTSCSQAKSETTGKAGHGQDAPRGAGGVTRWQWSLAPAWPWAARFWSICSSRLHYVHMTFVSVGASGILTDMRYFPTGQLRTLRLQEVKTMFLKLSSGQFAPGSLLKCRHSGCPQQGLGSCVSNKPPVTWLLGPEDHTWSSERSGIYCAVVSGGFSTEVRLASKPIFSSLSPWNGLKVICPSVFMC